MSISFAAAGSVAGASTGDRLGSSLFAGNAALLAGTDSVTSGRTLVALETSGTTGQTLTLGQRLQPPDVDDASFGVRVAFSVDGSVVAVSAQDNVLLYSNVSGVLTRTQSPVRAYNMPSTTPAATKGPGARGLGFTTGQLVAAQPYGEPQGEGGADVQFVQMIYTSFGSDDIQLRDLVYPTRLLADQADVQVARSFGTMLVVDRGTALPIVYTLRSAGRTTAWTQLQTVGATRSPSAPTLMTRAGNRVFVVSSDNSLWSYAWTGSKYADEGVRVPRVWSNTISSLAATESGLVLVVADVGGGVWALRDTGSGVYSPDAQKVHTSSTGTATVSLSESESLTVTLLVGEPLGGDAAAPNSGVVYRYTADVL